MLEPKIARLLVFLGGLLLAGCNTLPVHKVHYTMLAPDGPAQPKRILLLPMDISVSELTAGGMSQEVESWSEEASGYIDWEVRSGSHRLSGIEFVSMPELSPEEQAQVDQHLALLDAIGGNVLYVSRGPGSEAWAHKSTHFDYTFGEGLAFLKERTGADVALMIYGDDLISSGGRKAAFVFAAAFGVGIQMGHAVVVGAMVELETGNILWLNHKVAVDSTSLRKREDVATMIEGLFTDYPGVESYRKLVNRQPGTQ